MDEQPIDAPPSKARLMLGNLIGRHISLIGGAKKDEAPDIDALDLKMVRREHFDPFAKAEFVETSAGYLRNTFKPTRYMIEAKGEHGEPKTILRLIRHLMAEDEERFA